MKQPESIRSLEARRAAIAAQRDYAQALAAAIARDVAQLSEDVGRIDAEIAAAAALADVERFTPEELGADASKVNGQPEEHP